MNNQTAILSFKPLSKQVQSYLNEGKQTAAHLFSALRPQNESRPFPQKQRKPKRYRFLKQHLSLIKPNYLHKNGYSFLSS